MFKFLSTELPISRSFFLISEFVARLVGCWPQNRRSSFTFFIFWINFLLVTIGACGENFYGFVHIDDIKNALEAFCPGVTKAVCSLKMVIFFLYHQSWYKTTMRLKDMLDDGASVEKRKIIRKLAALGNSLNFFLLISGFATNVFFNLRPIITATYGVLKGREFPFELPFNIVLPHIFERMPLYPLTYAMLALSGSMTVFTFSAVDGYFLCACLYMSAMFRMLQQDIREIFSELKPFEIANVTQNARIRLELSAVVVRHNAINDLCTDFTSQFTVIILMHFLSASMVLCLSILNLMLNLGSLNMFTFVFYSIAALTQLCLYCIGGNHISESSLDVATTLYDIEWYKCDVRTRKMILMMLRRAQRAKTVAVPFFTPSLTSFASPLATIDLFIEMQVVMCLSDLRINAAKMNSLRLQSWMHSDTHKNVDLLALW